MAVLGRSFYFPLLWLILMLLQGNDCVMQEIKKVSGKRAQFIQSYEELFVKYHSMYLKKNVMKRSTEREGIIELMMASQMNSHLIEVVLEPPLLFESVQFQLRNHAMIVNAVVLDTNSETIMQDVYILIQIKYMAFRLALDILSYYTVKQQTEKVDLEIEPLHQTKRRGEFYLFLSELGLPKLFKCLENLVGSTKTNGGLETISTFIDGVNKFIRWYMNRCQDMKEVTNYIKCPVKRWELGECIYKKLVEKIEYIWTPIKEMEQHFALLNLDSKEDLVDAKPLDLHDLKRLVRYSRHSLDNEEKIKKDPVIALKVLIEIEGFKVILYDSRARRLSLPEDHRLTVYISLDKLRSSL